MAVPLEHGEFPIKERACVARTVYVKLAQSGCFQKKLVRCEWKGEHGTKFLGLLKTAKVSRKSD